MRPHILVHSIDKLSLLTVIIWSTALAFDIYGKRLAEIEYKHYAAALRSLKKRTQDARASEQRWVFAVKPDRGKDPAFADIDKYIISRLGYDAADIKNNKIVDLDENVLWFYVETIKEVAEDIAKRWNQIARPP
ncbi:hypothetical protein TWF718_005821 [Orbilia javanica]|uniref:Uncharacterized protein n=1 Tax=Orbilia javanica TaxID=47235 RepID=A0AAN8N8B1_9PEZI